MGIIDSAPQCLASDVIDLARWVRARARRPLLCPNPLDYAARLGLDAIPLHDHEALAPGPRELVFRRHDDARTQGGWVLIGVARCVLLMAGYDATIADIIALGRELALPAGAAQWLLQQEAEMLAPHAPVEMIAAQIALFSGGYEKR
jgi:hypothetical protein